MAKIQEGVIITYDPNNKENLKPIVEEIANDFSISGSGAITLNGAEVENITITGAGTVTADSKNATLDISNTADIDVNGSDTAIFSISGGASLEYDSATKVTTLIFPETGKLKASPQLQISTSNVSIGTYQKAIVTANTLSDSTFQFTVSDSDILSIQSVFNNMATIRAGQLTGSGKVAVQVNESAEYYPAIKTVNIISTNDLKVADLTFEGGQFNDPCNFLNWQNSGAVLEDNLCKCIGSWKYIFASLSELSLNVGNFTFDIDLKVTSNSSGQGLLTLYYDNPVTMAASSTAGIYLLANANANSLSWDVTSRNNAWDIIGNGGSFTDGVEFNLKLVRDSSGFKGYVDGVQVWQYDQPATYGLYVFAPYLKFGCAFGSPESNIIYRRIQVWKDAVI